MYAVMKCAWCPDTGRARWATKSLSAIHCPTTASRTAVCQVHDVQLVRQCASYKPSAAHLCVGLDTLVQQRPGQMLFPLLLLLELSAQASESAASDCELLEAERGCAV